MNLTVASVFVKGEYPYTPEYVTRLYAMVRRWIDRPFRAVCLTDQPWSVTDVETIPVTKLAGFAPWTKLELFNPTRNWDGRVLYLDLDSLIVAPLAPMLDTPGEFVITDDPQSQAKKRTHDSFGRLILRRFNSSAMLWDGGTQTDLYANWKPEMAKVLSGDQDYIGEKKPATMTWPREWFPRISELKGEPPTAPAKVVLCKVPKNKDAAVQLPWVKQAWG